MAKQIEQFTQTNLPQIRAAMNKAMEAVEKEFGIKIGLGNIKFSPDSFDLKMTVVTEKASGGIDSSVDPKWVADYNRYYLSYGLQASALGKEFDFQGKKAKLVGSRVRADKQIVIKVEGNDKFNIISAQQAVRLIHG